MNKVILMGRLTADPEIRATQSGTQVARWTVAINRSYTKDGNQQTDFVPCVAIGKTAEFVSRYFQKGGMIALDGEFRSSKYETKDGQNRTSYDCFVNHVEFCGGKAEQKTEEAEFDGFMPVGEEDLPF